MTNHVVWVRLCQAVGQIPCGWLLINGLPGRLRPSKKWLPKRHCRARILRPCQQRRLPEILGGFFLVAREGVPLVEGFFWFFAHGDIGWSNYTARWFDYYNIIILLIHIYIYISYSILFCNINPIYGRQYHIQYWCDVVHRFHPSAAEAHLTGQGGATRARVAWRIPWVVKMPVLTGEIRRMMERYGTIYWMSETIWLPEFFRHVGSFSDPLYTMLFFLDFCNVPLVHSFCCTHCVSDWGSSRAERTAAAACMVLAQSVIRQMGLRLAPVRTQKWRKHCGNVTKATCPDILL